MLDDRHQAIVGRCAHTMGPSVIDVDGDRATATGYVRLYVRDLDMANPRLWRISYTKLGLERADTTWRIANRLSRPLGADDGAEVLRSGQWPAAFHSSAASAPPDIVCEMACSRLDPRGAQ